MAQELHDTAGVREWSAKFRRTADLINRYMWDPKDRFYYNVAMSDNTFEFEGKSLKRKELIGFLPMWAHVATKEQAGELVKHLTDPGQFWRRYGVPTLAANDPNYTPFVDGCCRWNGPVWLLWDYIVMRGLRNYGYHDIARAVADTHDACCDNPTFDQPSFLGIVQPRLSRAGEPLKLHLGFHHGQSAHRLLCEVNVPDSRSECL